MFHSKDLNHTYVDFPESQGIVQYYNEVRRKTTLINSLLEDEGGIYLGKTSVPTLEYRADTRNAIVGVTRNPLDPSKTPGGSSGGAAAAIRAGIGHVGLANDSAGSIRIPACFTGTFGIKPSTTTLISEGFNCGVTPMNKETANGTITRTLEDTAIVWDIFTQGFYHYEDTVNKHGSVKMSHFADKRIAFLATFPYNHIDPVVLATMEELFNKLERSGATIDKVDTLGWNQDPDEAAGILWRRKIGSFNSPLTVEFIRKEVEAYDPFLVHLADSAKNITEQQTKNALEFKLMVV